MHKQAELKALQQKVSDAKALHVKQTEKLITEQREILEAESALLLKEIAKEQKTLRKIKLSIKNALERHTTLEATIVDKELQSTELDRVLVSAQSALNEATHLVVLANESQVIIQNDIQDLETRKSEISEEITTLEQRLDVQKADVAYYQTHYEASKKQHDEEESKTKQNLQLSENKILENTQLFEQQTREIELTRSELASWHKALEERDQNLRIREQKVEQGENKIIRNSNLLNL